MTFRDFFSQALKKDIISLFQELGMSSDIIIKHLGKDNKTADVDLYEIKNKYFENRILIKHDVVKSRYYISCYGDYEPGLSEDIVSYIGSKFDTEVLVRNKLEGILYNINYYNEKLKDFGDTKPLMDIDDIEVLNQVYKALGMSDKEIIVDTNKPYSTWMTARFFIVQDLDEIKQWIQTQIEIGNKDDQSVGDSEESIEI